MRTFCLLTFLLIHLSYADDDSTSGIQKILNCHVEHIGSINLVVLEDHMIIRLLDNTIYDHEYYASGDVFENVINSVGAFFYLVDFPTSTSMGFQLHLNRNLESGVMLDNQGHVRLVYGCRSDFDGSQENESSQSKSSFNIL